MNPTNFHYDGSLVSRNLKVSASFYFKPHGHELKLLAACEGKQYCCWYSADNSQ